MDKYEKGRAFALDYAEKFGYVKAEANLEMVIRANPGRPADDPYVMGIRAGLAQAKTAGVPS